MGCRLSLYTKLATAVSTGILLHGCATPPGTASSRDVFEVRQEVAQFVNPVRNASGCQLTVVSIVEEMGQDTANYMVGIDDEGAMCNEVLNKLNQLGAEKGYRFVTMQVLVVPPAGSDRQQNQDLLHRVDPGGDR